MKQVLISGGAGYIGSFTANLFIKSGYAVTIIDNLSTGHSYAIPKEAEFIQAELLDKPEILSKLASKKFVGLIHFAAKALVGESVADPDLYYLNNVFGSINLFQAVRTIGINKIIFSSTAAVYGEPKSELVETHEKSPVNPYGNTKRIVEHYLKDSTHAYGTRAIALRYFNACGAASDSKRGEVHKPETHLIPLVVGAALGIYPELKVFGADYNTPDGSAIRDYIHVEDLAAAHLAAFEFLDTQKAGYFEPFNVGTGKGHSVLEVVAAAKKVLGKEVPHKIVARREGDPAILVAKVDKINKILGWKAERTDLEQILSGVITWMEENREKF
jgi:UDP-glucose 4-epimerase